MSALHNVYSMPATSFFHFREHQDKVIGKLKTGKCLQHVISSRKQRHKEFIHVQ